MLETPILVSYHQVIKRVDLAIFAVLSPQHIEPYANYGDVGQYTHVLADCSVCSENYASTLGSKCSKCSDTNQGVVIAVFVAAILAVLALVWKMVSIEREDSNRGIVVHVDKVLPLQSIKIMIVAWQIVTQVRTREMLTYPPY